MPEREPRTIDYGAIAAAYARHRQVHPDVLRALIEGGTVSAGARVLEVGCGTGNYIAAIQALTACRAWGIDPAEGMLAAAQARGADVAFQPGSAGRLDFPDRTFDLVFSVDVIHNVPDLDAAYAEAWRVLRDGGRCCTVTDSEWIIRHREPLTSYFPESAEVDLRRYPGVPALVAAMRRAGFAEVTEQTVEHRYPLTDLEVYRRRAYSCLQLIGDEAHARGLARLERDLQAGPVTAVTRYVLIWGGRRPDGA